MQGRDISSKSFRPQKPENKENKKTRRLIWISTTIVVSLILAQCMIIAVNDLFAINRQEESIVEIEILKGSKVAEVADILEKNGVIKNKLFFIIYAQVTKASADFIPGSFQIKTNLDYEAIINYIQSNKNRLEKDILNVTLQEGLSVIECAKVLEQNEVCDKEEFLNLCKSNDFDDNYDFLKNISNFKQRYYKLEGYLFPDTYKFYKNERAKDVIRRFLNNYEAKVTERKKVNGYDKKVSVEDMAKEIGMTPEDLLTLASLIQAEAADNNDMYKVSSVFHNRLNTLKTNGVSKYGDEGLDMLGSDVTVWYPYRTRLQVPIDLVDKFESTYDTYKIKGLPAGPVCNPGEAAIDAALHPSKTDYYYFCHSKDKKAYYAKTLSDHNNNLKKAGLA